MSKQENDVFVVSPEDSLFQNITDGSIDKIDDNRKLYELRKILKRAAGGIAVNYHSLSNKVELEAPVENMVALNISSKIISKLTWLFAPR